MARIVRRRVGIGSAALENETRPLRLCTFLLFVIATGALAQDWKSGQDSPVHDSDRLYQMSAKLVMLENDRLSLGFDQNTGALLSLVNKDTGWHWQTDPTLGESFNLFVPTTDRSYSPVLGIRNHLTSFEKSVDGQSLTLVWSHLQSEYQGTLDITLHGTVHLEHDTARFEMTVENHSPHTIASLSWPIIGSAAQPQTVMKGIYRFLLCGIPPRRPRDTLAQTIQPGFSTGGSFLCRRPIKGFTSERTTRTRKKMCVTCSK